MQYTIMFIFGRLGSLSNGLLELLFSLLFPPERNASRSGLRRRRSATISGRWRPTRGVLIPLICRCRAPSVSEIEEAETRPPSAILKKGNFPPSDWSGALPNLRATSRVEIAVLTHFPRFPSLPPAGFTQVCYRVAKKSCHHQRPARNQASSEDAGSLFRRTKRKRAKEAPLEVNERPTHPRPTAPESDNHERSRVVLIESSSSRRTEKSGRVRFPRVEGGGARIRLFSMEFGARPLPRIRS